MTLKTTKLREAISFALAISATGVAFAQQPVAPVPQEQDATELDRIEVTGSRIRQVDVETQQPVLTVTREDIDKQGFQSVGDILQNISAVGTPPISRAAPLSAGENVGGTFISLRNLGAARTLILVNGRRAPITTSGLADVSLIPAAAVERVEVLKDGASSIYGSDAISGVINIITRTNYDGAQASAYYGQYGQGDGEITRGDFVMGFTGDRGSLTIAAEWTDEKGVDSSDRPFSAFPRSDIHPTLGWTTVHNGGGFISSPTVNTIPGFVYPPATPANPTRSVRVVLRPGGNDRVATDYIAQNIDDNSIIDKTNTNEQTDLRTDLSTKSLYADGVFDITENVRFRTNLLYTNRETERQVAGYPMQANGGFAIPTPLSINSYFNPFRTGNTSGATPQAINNWWRRTTEVARVSGTDQNVFRFVGSFEGSFDFADRFVDWDISYLRSDTDLVQTSFGNLNLARLAQATGPSFLNAQGQVQCGTAVAPIAFATCQPFNPFVPFGTVAPGGLTGNTALQNFLYQTEQATGDTQTEVISANIASTIFTLPAGDLGFAFGLENRKESGGFTPDALSVTGGSTNLGAGPGRGGYSVDEAYLELAIPLLADLPFAQEFSLSLASRYSDFDTFGDTTNNKFGFKWKPFESVLVRGTYADGFRAPTINDLFGGGSQTFAFYTDPCDTQFGASRVATSATRANCVARLGPIANTFRQIGQGGAPTTVASSQTPIAFTSGPNAALLPELSTSKTLGVVWSPDFVEGLNLALDWWQIRVDSTIVADSPNQILGDCYNDNIDSRCGPSVGGGTGFTRDPATGQIVSLNFGQRNAGYREVEGFDFDVSYRYATDNWGSFSTNWNSTYTSRDEFVNTNAAGVTNPSQSVSFGSTFRIRSNLNLTWEMGSFGASWTARYYSAIKESCLAAARFPDECTDPNYSSPNLFGAPVASPVNRTGSNTFNDVQFRWTAPWNATVALGANNVFERYGPVLYSQPSANTSYYGGFDIGRFVYMKYTQRF